MKSNTIQTIRHCGAAEMPVAESCVIAGITLDDFVNTPELANAYRAGQLDTKFRIHQAIVRMAKKGVPQMVKIYEESIAQPMLPIIQSQPQITHEGQEVLDDESDS